MEVSDDNDKPYLPFNQASQQRIPKLDCEGIINYINYESGEIHIVLRPKRLTRTPVICMQEHAKHKKELDAFDAAMVVNVTIEAKPTPTPTTRK